MRIDYSARRQVSVNRPKKNPFRPILVLALTGGSVLFGLGIATGWLIFGQGKQASAPPSQGGKPTAPSTAQTAAAATPPKSPAATETPHLTFYDSLPKGDKELIGTGLNPNRNNAPSAPSKAAQPPAPADTQQKPARPQKLPSSPPADDSANRASAPDPRPPLPVDNKGTAAGKAVQVQQKPSTSTATYTVQLASYRERKEAEDLKEKWANKGYSAHIVESTINGKGKLYRVRIGNRMSRETANQLSAKLGSGAIAVPEQGKNDGKPEKR